jgi:tRNA pseudouridine55 synthase
MLQKNVDLKPKPSGILILDKPCGLSSNQVLQKVKWQLKNQYGLSVDKIGHAGTLDPEASGLLPILINEATKFAQYPTDFDKKYEVRACLGVTRDTGDSAGAVLQTREVGAVSFDELNKILQAFQGEQTQIPPMYSALKKDGVPLYRLARQGLSIDRPARPICLKSLTLFKVELPYFEFEVFCSKGTYVRTLVEDIGETLGMGAYVDALRRTQSGCFDLSRSLTLESLMQGLDLSAFWVPVDCLVKHLAQLEVTDQDRHHLAFGRKIALSQAYQAVVGNEVGRIVRLYSSSNLFLGLAEIVSDPLSDSVFGLQPKRLMADLG